MKYRTSEETRKVELPVWFQASGTIRATDGIAKDVNFKLTLDDIEVMLDMIQDRAKVDIRRKDFVTLVEKVFGHTPADVTRCPRYRICVLHFSPPAGRSFYVLPNVGPGMRLSRV